jgi:hypothetical protein
MVEVPEIPKDPTVGRRYRYEVEITKSKGSHWGQEVQITRDINFLPCQEKAK